MEQTAITIPESTELKAEAMGALERANVFKVVNNETLTAAGELRNDFVERGKKLDAIFDPGIGQAHALHKHLLATKAACADPYTNGAKIIKGKMIAYEEEQRRLRAIEQARLDLLERRKAEEERIAAAKALQEEAHRQEEARRAEEERLLAEAAELDAKGNKAAAEALLATAEALETDEATQMREEAKEILEAPVTAAPVVAPKLTPKLAGFSYRSVWKAEVVSIKAMLEGWKAGKVPTEAFEGNPVFLRTLKQAAVGKYPGIKVWEEKA
jgi:hypothetical protein